MIGTIAIIIAFAAIVFMLLSFVIDFSPKETDETVDRSGIKQ